MATSTHAKSSGTGLPDFDFTKILAEMKLPTLPNMDAFVTANRKNTETLSAVNRIAMEGAQAVARRQMEIMQQSMSEIAEAMTALASMKSPRAKAAKQAELVKTAYEHSLANMKELSDLIRHANGEALTLINKRFAEAMDEVKALAQKVT